MSKSYVFTNHADEKLSYSRSLFIVWIAIVFLIWLVASITNFANEGMADIPPTLVAFLGLLAGGEASRDLIYWRIRSIENEYDDLSLSRVLFLLWSTVIFIFWLIATFYAKKLADIPTEVVTILALLAGGETTQQFVLWRAMRNELTAANTRDTGEAL